MDRNKRRAQLREMLPNCASVFCAGALRPRNYAGNPYPFRASSHFLYFFGDFPPGSCGVVAESGSFVYVPARNESDALWDGPSPDWAQVAKFYQLDEIKPLDKLAQDLKCANSVEILALPAPDPASGAVLGEFLGRKPDLLAKDKVLAQAVVSLRLRHDDASLSELKTAAAITVAAHRAAKEVIRPGMREFEVLAEMEREVRRQNAGVAFSPIVSIHGETLHNSFVGNTLADGDLLLCDFGAETETGYAGDVTRTWPVGGKLSPIQKEFYDLTLAAQADAIAAVKPGVRFKDVHLTACRTICDGLCRLGLLKGDPAELTELGAHALFFPHGIGHLLGLDVHDLEDLGDLAGYEEGQVRSSQFGLNYLRLDRVLKERMLVTIEPGVYFVPEILHSKNLISQFKEFLNRELAEKVAKEVRGIRIEDEVLVTAEGCEVLTQGLPK